MRIGISRGSRAEPMAAALLGAGLLVSLVLGAACNQNSRDVMFRIDAARSGVAQALDAGDLDAARRDARRLVGLLGSSLLLEGRSGESVERYSAMLANSRGYAEEVARAGSASAARAALGLLEHSCQACHDAFQFKPNDARPLKK